MDERERHAFRASYSGMVCSQMVLRDGGGDSCGEGPGHEVHDVGKVGQKTPIQRGVEALHEALFRREVSDVSYRELGTLEALVKAGWRPSGESVSIPVPPPDELVERVARALWWDYVRDSFDHEPCQGDRDDLWESIKAETEHGELGGWGTTARAALRAAGEGQHG